MDIFPSEIESVETMGELDGNPVKIVKTVGGYYMAIAKKNKKDSVIGGASHPAILRYNIQKASPSFKPSLMKSEYYNQFQVLDRSKNLTQEQIDMGYSIYQIKENDRVVISLAKNSHELATATLTPVQNGYKLSHTVKPEHSHLLKSLSKSAVDVAAYYGRDIVV